MTQAQVELQRNGQPLGSIPVAEVQILVEARFLLPTDEFRLAGQPLWKALAQFEGEPLVSPTSLAERMQAVVAEATKPTGQFLGQVTRKTAELRNAPHAALSKATQKVLADYLPSLQELTRASLSRLQRAGNTALRAEEFLRKLFGAIYDSPPRPVYRFVSEQQIIDFCLRHRHRLLGAGESKPD